MGSLLGAWYREGTVDVVNNSNIITGNSTQWLSALIAVVAGDIFTTDNHTWYEVVSVDLDTNILLDRVFEGSTDSDIKYAIIRSTSGTVATTIAGQVALQFNQKQVLLDEIHTWLTSSNPSEDITDSNGQAFTLATPAQMDADHQQKVSELETLMLDVVANTSFHIWKAYADDAIGTGITVDPTGKEYIGFAMNQSTSVISIVDPSLFDWSLLKGSDAAPAINSYTHIAYADDANGTNFSDISTGRTFIGIYSDSNIDDSLFYNDYSWSEIPKGNDGYNATVVSNGSGTYTITGANGSITISDGLTPTITDNGDGTKTIDDGYGNIVTIKDGADGSTPLKGAGLDYNDGNSGDYVSFVFREVTTGDPAPSVSGGSYDGAIEITPVGYTDDPIYTDGKTTYVAKRRYSHDIETGGWTGGAWSTPVIFADKGLQGLQGLRGLQGLQGDAGEQGVKGVEGTSTYFHIAYADTITGTGFSQSPTGKIYIGTYVDSNINDSTNPADYAWQLVKGSDGVKGDQGIKGDNGSSGATSYLHIAYATNATGTAGFSVNNSVGKTYIGQYVDFTAGDSTNPALYSWTLIKGSDGAPATEKHSWTVYSDSKTSGVIYTNNSGNRTYTGVAHNMSTPTPLTNSHSYYNWYVSLDVLDLGKVAIAGKLDAGNIDVGTINIDEANWGNDVSISVPNGIYSGNGYLGTRIFAKADSSGTGLYVESTSQSYSAIATNGRMQAYGDISSAFGSIRAPSVKVNNHEVYHPQNPPPTSNPSGYNSSNWNTAYGWGNHASAGYAASTSLSSYVKYGGGSYSLLMGKNNSSSDWLRTTTNGLLPYQAGGASGSLGTGAWRFANIYGVIGNFSGLVTMTAGYTTSDGRVKANQSVIKDASKKVGRLTGKTYNRTDLDGMYDAGIIAQDLIGNFDVALAKNEDDKLGTKYGVSPMALIGLLVQAHNEHTDEINLLKQRLAALEA